MKTISITEANQNFSKAAKLADSEPIMIEKNKKGRYVLMTTEQYQKIAKDILWGKIGNKVVKAEIGIQTTITMAEESDYGTYFYEQYIVPIDTVEIKNDVLTINMRSGSHTFGETDETEPDFEIIKDMFEDHEYTIAKVDIKNAL